MYGNGYHDRLGESEQLRASVSQSGHMISLLCILTPDRRMKQSLAVSRFVALKRVNNLIEIVNALRMMKM